MLTVGLTGGIGAGKSSVSALLAARGAVVVDADLLARQAVAPGTPGLAAVQREFGPQVLLPDGSLDRPALGRVVFSDPHALARLNAVVHPVVRELTKRAVEAARAADAEVVVHDVPLLVENGLHGAGLYDAVVVVAARPETQLDRLVRQRGMSEPDARARVAAQAPLADKLAVATHVVHNDGVREELEPQVDALWADLRARAQRSVTPRS